MACREESARPEEWRLYPFSIIIVRNLRSSSSALVVRKTHARPRTPTRTHTCWLAVATMSQSLRTPSLRAPTGTRCTVCPRRPVTSRRPCPGCRWRWPGRSSGCTPAGSGRSRPPSSSGPRPAGTSRTGQGFRGQKQGIYHRRLNIELCLNWFHPLGQWLCHCWRKAMQCSGFGLGILILLILYIVILI